MQFQVGLSQRSGKPPAVSHMIGPRLAVHDSVVDVSDGESPPHTTEEHVHHSLENSRARSETEGQSAFLTLAVGGHEAGFGASLFLNLYFVELVAHIHNREVLFAPERGQNILHTRKRLLRHHNMLVTPSRSLLRWSGLYREVTGFVGKPLSISIGKSQQPHTAPRDVMRSWGPHGAGKAAWAWAWGSLICVGCALSAEFCIPWGPL